MQPGVGNPVAGARDLHAGGDVASGRCTCCARGATSPACWSIRCRRCIPNASAPGDSSLVDSARSAQLRPRGLYRLAASSCAQVCTERGIVLIFDEVFVGFRLAPGGAQEYFGVRADMVTYGKTLGGGLPVGVRLRPQRADEALPRRSSGRHLLRARHLQLASLRDGGDERVPAPARRARDPRALSTTSTRPGTAAPRGSTSACARQDLPVQVANLSSIWTVLLHRAVALQLDAAILSARRGAGAELGRHRPADLQPELHRRRFRRGRRPLRRGGARRCSATAGGGATPRSPTRRSAARSCARCSLDVRRC